MGVADEKSRGDGRGGQASHSADYASAQFVDAGYRSEIGIVDPTTEAFFEKAMGTGGSWSPGIKVGQGNIGEARYNENRGLVMDGQGVVDFLQTVSYTDSVYSDSRTRDPVVDSKKVIKPRESFGGAVLAKEDPNCESVSQLLHDGQEIIAYLATLHYTDDVYSLAPFKLESLIQEFSDTRRELNEKGSSGSLGFENELNSVWRLGVAVSRLKLIKGHLDNT